MAGPHVTVDVRTNHLQLVADFVRIAMRAEPASVYDVGCGSGGVLRAFAEQGVAVRGLDQEGPQLDELRAQGVDVDAGSAYALPVADASFDWVAMRHVPHHLEDPARAFAEAWRVARRGVWIAEPYFETSLPEGRAALELDRWEKQLHHRQGRYHAEVHDVDELLAMLPPDALESGADRAAPHAPAHAALGGRLRARGARAPRRSPCGGRGRGAPRGAARDHAPDGAGLERLAVPHGRARLTALASASARPARRRVRASGRQRVIAFRTRFARAGPPWHPSTFDFL